MQNIRFRINAAMNKSESICMLTMSCELPTCFASSTDRYYKLLLHLLANNYMGLRIYRQISTYLHTTIYDIKYEI